MDITNIAELRKNFKYFMEKIISSNEPLLITGPKNKKAVLLSYDHFNNLNKSNNNINTTTMENSKTKNWYNDYLINESINGNVEGIIGTYVRLTINFPNHKDFNKWNEESNKWNDYKNKLHTLVLPTKEKATELKESIANNLRIIDKLETKLLAEKNKKSVAIS